MNTRENQASGSRAGRMRSLLERDFQPVRLDIEDESAKHAGHAGARDGGETHYVLTIVSAHFHRLGRVERSRMVHQALRSEFESGLHALSLILRSPDEIKTQ